MPQETNKPTSVHVRSTSFFQPRSLPNSKFVDHQLADSVDRLRELIHRAKSNEDLDLRGMRLTTGARSGSVQEALQRVKAQ